MEIAAQDAGTSESLTPSEAAAQFADLFSDEVVETEEVSAKPPAQESPEPESEDAEVSTEQTEAEDESTDETEESEGEAEEKAEEVFTVKVDGEEIQVTRDELLKGYSRQADYSRKTMQIAEEKKQFLAEAAAVSQERAKYAELLKTLEETITQYEPQEPDWRYLQTTMEPGEFAREYALWSQHKQEKANIQREREAVEQTLRAEQEKALREHLAEQHRLLIEAVPEWQDGEKLKAAKAELTAAAEAVGFTAQDLNRVSDYRLVMLLRKAALYDASQKKRPELQKRVETVKIAKPGSKGELKGKKKTPLEIAEKRLAQTGSVRDAAAAMMALED